MNKQEIINKLATKDNFKTLVEICLKEGLEINQYNSFPEINVYHHNEDNSSLGDTCWTEIKPKVDQFEVDGVILKGTTNFFKNYKKITKIIQTRGKEKTILRVIPNFTAKEQWSCTNDWCEISFDCHSFSKPALQYFEKGELQFEQYYVDGDMVDYENWIKESRENKLSRILNIDLKSQRLEKEKIEKEKEKIEKEKEIAKAKRLKEKETNWSNYGDDSKKNYTIWA